MVPVTSPCFVVKKIRKTSNFHYRIRDVSTQLLHCRIHTWNFVFIGNTKSSTKVYQYLRTVCFDFSFSLSTVKHQHKSKQELQTTHFIFLKLVVTVRCNSEGIFSSPNCPDQHQGPPSLPLNQYWGS
jgi:hypothetical protein